MFAEFAIRMLAIALDVFAAMFVASALHDHVWPLLGLTYTDHRPTVMVLVFLYFLLSWLSPMRATPMQYLLGMRVVSTTGEKLSPGRAALRSLLLIGLIEASLAVFRPPVAWYTGLLGLIVYASLLLAIFDRRRQAGHDKLIGSLVVNRKAATKLRFDAPAAAKRPPVISMLGNIVFFAIPIVVFSTFGQVEYDKNLRSRVAYAYGQTGDLRAAIELHHLEFDRFPDSAAELGTGERSHYPEGGWYELEQAGGIRIRFTVIEDLKKGSLLFYPEKTSDGIDWSCRREGELESKYMPAYCRD